MTKEEFKTLKVGDKVKSLIQEISGAERDRIYEVTAVCNDSGSMFGYHVTIKLPNGHAGWPMSLPQIELVHKKTVKNLRKRIEKGK